MSVGERIAIYRRRRGLSQLALANMIGRSEAWLSQVERGLRHVDRVSVLIRLAQVLKVTVEDLIGQPLSLAPNGGIEFRAIPTLRAALTDYEVIPATFGIALGEGPVRDLPSLRRNVDQANRLYQAAHYDEAGLLCSRLIGEAQRATRELTGDDRRGAFRVLAETYHITAKTLNKVGETELAWIAAERSLPAAQWSGGTAAAGGRRLPPWARLSPSYPGRAGRWRRHDRSASLGTRAGDRHAGAPVGMGRTAPDRADRRRSPGRPGHGAPAPPRGQGHVTPADSRLHS
jgi:transcriptional regulator with XRE-family HTH domain